MSNDVEHFTKEKRILMAMRKTLGNVVKDVTPSSSALKSPLTASTIEDIKMCFGLIAAREQEIAKEAGVELKQRPQYVDEPTKTNVVSLDSLKNISQKSNKE
ncbi:MAG: segregation and condensation protein A [Cocleimonas sp.]